MKRYYFDIDCQLEEIVKKLEDGHHEERLARDVGFSLHAWWYYKKDYPERVNALLRDATLLSDKEKAMRSCS